MNTENSKTTLAGCRLLVTRPEEVCARSVEVIEEMGGRGFALPAVAIGPPADLSALSDAVGRARDFDWILFTSTRSVPPFVEELQGGQAPLLGAVGPLTARRLDDLGLPVNLVPEDRHDGEGLARAWGAAVNDPQCRILLPRSDRALDLLPRLLREMGAEVEEVEAYRTRPRAIRRAQLAQIGPLDGILLASPSAVTGLFSDISPRELSEMMPGVVLAAIGPTTAEAVEAVGGQVEVIAEAPTWGALLTATAAQLEARPN